MAYRTQLETLQFALIELEYATSDFIHDRQSNEKHDNLNAMLLISTKANRALYDQIFKQNINSATLCGYEPK